MGERSLYRAVRRLAVSTLETCAGLISFGMGAIFQVETLLVVVALGLVAIGLRDLFYWMVPFLQVRTRHPNKKTALKTAPDMYLPRSSKTLSG